MTRYWIGVVSRDHVLASVAGAFCQFNHGKRAPVEELSRGDKVVFYSPRSSLREGKPVQAFTASGEITDETPYQAEQNKDFKPFRRHTTYAQASDAPIQPLLSQLSFTRDQPNWGMILRRGFFEITAEDYSFISDAMHL